MAVFVMLSAWRYNEAPAKNVSARLRVDLRLASLPRCHAQGHMKSSSKPKSLL